MAYINVVKIITSTVMTVYLIQRHVFYYSYRQVVEKYVHLASPLHAFYAELSCGLNFVMKYFSFSFLSIILSEFIL